MGLNKKDRRISIWIGVLIGITLSSMLFRYAINDKNERASTRKGSYQSGVTAISGLPCPPIPEILKKTIPQGIVIHYEANQSVSDFEKSYQTDCWVIESSGAIRSERLFILAEIKKGKDIAFYRASELYLTAEDGVDETTLSNCQQISFGFWAKIAKLLNSSFRLRKFLLRQFSTTLRNCPFNSQM